MRSLPCLVLLACIILCTGCATTTTSSSQSAQTIPDLVGNWTGTARGFSEGYGLRDFPQATITMSVANQTDRFFSGTMVFPQMNGTTRTEGFAGIISHDGKTFRMVEFDSHEHDDGWILSKNEIEMVFIADEEPQKIILDTFHRVT